MLDGFKKTILALGLAVLLVTTAFCYTNPVWGQAEDAPATTVDKNNISGNGNVGESGPQMKSIKDMFEVGGGMMYVILLLSVVSLAFIIHYFMLLSENRLMPKGLVEKIYHNIARGDIEQARKLCETSDCLVGKVILGGLKNADLGNRKVTEGMEASGAREASSLFQKISYLQNIGVISPMCGLLGTVLGMLNAFSAISMSDQASKTIVLGGSINQALITTAFGLIVAIPAFIAYYYFKGRVHKAVTNVEMIAEDVSNAVVARGIRK